MDGRRIAILAGGDSAERSVSLASGECVAAALEAAGHAIDLFDPARIDLADIPWAEFDACFIALHGGAGEDGRIQRRLELLKVPYTGSGPAACRLAMSKSSSKERFLQAGVPTLPYVLFGSAERGENVAAQIAGQCRPISPKSAAGFGETRLHFPLVIKPDSQGSSLGVSVAHRPDDLEACLARCRLLDDYAIVETFISGREFTVAVVDRQALPLLEIVKPGQLFDYQAKYSDPATQYRFESGFPAAQIAAMEQIAVAAAACLHTKGLCRVDLMLDQAGRPWVLEVNAVPGLTEHSLAPMAARQAGLSMPQLCDLLVRQCLAAEVAR
jgi:D-alanine-D-alanine ligase